MEEMQNMLKEIDIKVVRERLKARKKNLTGLGGREKAPKKMLAEAYRGWYGYETRYSALLRTSSETVSRATARNERLRLKHLIEMNNLIHEEQNANGKASKNIQAMREDFRSMLAYQYVYKTHGFKHYDSSRELNRPTVRPLSDKTAFSEGDIPRPPSQQITRPLGSLRESQNYHYEMRLPSIDKKKEMNDGKPASVQERAPSSLSFGTGEMGTSFPKINEAMGVEIRYLTKDEDNQSVYSIHTDGTLNSPLVGNKPSLQGLDMGQNLIRMKQLEQQKYNQETLKTLSSDPQKPRKRMLPATPSSQKRMLPKTPTERPVSVFPKQVKNGIGMKKFYQREATDFMSSWTSESRRKEEVEKLKKERKDPSYNIIERTRSTSAIFREFQRIKNEKENIRQVQEDQPMIVRQLSPVQREGSVVSQRKAAYSSRVFSPFPRSDKGETDKSRSVTETRPDEDLSSDDEIEVHEINPNKDLDEKFPSVSRTSSYRTLPDDPLEMHENARLTAAERIEKELRSQKATQQKAHVSHIVAVDPNEPHDGRTVMTDSTDIPLPTKHQHQTKRSIYTPKTKTTLKEKMSSTDFPIMKVQQANSGTLLTGNGTWYPGVSMKPPIPKTGVRIGEKTISRKGKGHKPVIMDEGARIEFMPSHFDYNDYDNYSRVTPGLKQKLEARAKKKRQKQLEKAKQIEESYPRKQKDSNSDRPTTRVSFNENVLVYQTM